MHSLSSADPSLILEVNPWAASRQEPIQHLICSTHRVFVFGTWKSLEISSVLDAVNRRSVVSTTVEAKASHVRGGDSNHRMPDGSELVFTRMLNHQQQVPIASLTRRNL